MGIDGFYRFVINLAEFFQIIGKKIEKKQKKINLEKCLYIGTLKGIVTAISIFFCN